MELNKDFVHLWWQDGFTIDGAIKFVAECATVCYGYHKVDDPVKFVNNLIKNKHFSPLEHGTLYLKIPSDVFRMMDLDKSFLSDGFVERYNFEHSRIVTHGNMEYVSTSYLEFITAKFPVAGIDGSQYIVEPTNQEFDDGLFFRRRTFYIGTSIAISRELNRYRMHSICEQSTRYCNFSSDKFGGVQFSMFRNPNMNIHNPWNTNLKEWISDKLVKIAFKVDSVIYNTLIKHFKWKAEDARLILPLQTQTKMVHTCFNDEWLYFLDKRLSESTGKVHPEMRAIATRIASVMHVDLNEDFAQFSKCNKEK